MISDAVHSSFIRVGISLNDSISSSNDFLSNVIFYQNQESFAEECPLVAE